jgi:gliding motility-associated-like protein
MYASCCRTEDLVNILDPLSSGIIYTASIPGTDIAPDAPENSSPLISNRDTVIICAGSYFEYNFEASDIENDILRYGFAAAYNWVEEVAIGPPPYPTLFYSPNFTPGTPLGADVTIDPLTGMISGIAPASGVYVITVVIHEIRHGTVINTHRKDLHIKVAPCSIAEARLEPTYLLCKGPIAFTNLSSSRLIKTFHWDFGVPGDADTSTLERPVFNFPDTGIYCIMLITNRGDECSDTAYSIVRNYPGIEGAMDIEGGCINSPVRFTDNSTSGYGPIEQRKWYFSNSSSNIDTSILKEPLYTYTSNGTYKVSLIVQDVVGCKDTVDNSIVIKDKPFLDVSPDTLICSRDTIRLRATGAGAIRWSPEYMISNSSTPDPQISPDVSTMYYASLLASPGCTNTDSVWVEVKRSVALKIPESKILCVGDSVVLDIQTDGRSFLWTPALHLNDPRAKNPVAKAGSDETLYQVRVNLGSCEETGGIAVRGIPYPTADAGSDTAVCYGSSVKLKGSGGYKYVWSPGSGLSNKEIPDPVAQPLATTVYALTVYDNKGCAKPSFDSVRVSVHPIPKAFAGNDTMIITGHPLQLKATGGTSYLWQPSFGLSNVNIAEPVATLTNDMMYMVTVRNSIGCADTDTIKIKVLLTEPDILVPTAFTPNNDRKNDILKPIPVGVTRLVFFRVFDRYGNMIYNTNTIGDGWNGRYQGKEQVGGTYVWAVQGLDYTGKIITKKGTVTLLR